MGPVGLLVRPLIWMNISLLLNNENFILYSWIINNNNNNKYLTRAYCVKHAWLYGFVSCWFKHETLFRLQVQTCTCLFHPFCRNLSFLSQNHPTALVPFYGIPTKLHHWRPRPHRQFHRMKWQVVLPWKLLLRVNHIVFLRFHLFSLCLLTIDLIVFFNS